MHGLPPRHSGCSEASRRNDDWPSLDARSGSIDPQLYDNPVRLIDISVDELDLAGVGRRMLGLLTQTIQRPELVY